MIPSTDREIRRLLCVLVPLCAVITPSSSLGQSPAEPNASGAGPVELHADAPRAMAVRIPGSIQIDGRLNDASWVGVPPITRFTQIDPEEGEAATQPTEVRIVYDDEALYVGAMLYDLGEIQTRLARRDARIPDSDLFSVYIDSYHDHQTAYRFATNPSGQKLDEIVSDFSGGRAGIGLSSRPGVGVGGRPSGSGDTSWDPVWEVATDQSDSGWSVEMRIPFSQFRFSRQEVQEWGIQLERIIRRREEQVFFAFVPKLERGGPARYGHLDGIRDVEPGRRLELLPYAAVQAKYLHLEEETDAVFGNPFRSGSEYFPNMGLDLKYRASSNMTLDGTLNPDFGQVEVDPAVINLTAFETRYEEKRPFFVEGRDIFLFSNQERRGSTGGPPEFLYSRRIGRPPHGSVPSASVYADEIGTTTILGAAKLTGRTQNGWSVGLLEAITQRETVSWVDEAAVHSKVVTEPGTNYLIGRLRRDALGGRSRLGMMASAVNRNLRDPTLLDHLHSSAYQAGVDFGYEWADRTWSLNSAFTSSLVQGSADALLLTQRSSARYFQRPDADHLQVDPQMKSMAGYFAMLKLARISGAFQMKVDLAAESPGYEINDIGFQTRTDRLIVDTNFTFQETVPGNVFRTWAIRTGPDMMWNYGGDLVHGQVVIVGDWQLLNYWGGSARIRWHPSVDDDRLNRGGPLAEAPQSFSGSFDINSDIRRPYSVRAGYRWLKDQGGTWENTANVNLTYRLRENWEVQISPRYSRTHASAQYVTAIDDPLAQNTFGKRYIFAALEQKIFSLEARLNLTLSPTLSFELYAQPFLSSGDYGDLKEFQTPRTFDFLYYGQDVGMLTDRGNRQFLVDPDGDGPARQFGISNHDFNHRSLLGNAVLRWEWRAGSTLYLVWQQNRSRHINAWNHDEEVDQIGTFGLGRDTDALLDIRPDNIFQLKVSYWLNP